MKYTVIKASDSEPAEILLATDSLDMAVGTVVEGVAGISRAVAGKGYRLAITDSSRPNGFVGNVFVEEDRRTGKAFDAEFETQFAPIRERMAGRLAAGKATAVFVNDISIVFNRLLASYTVVTAKE